MVEVEGNWTPDREVMIRFCERVMIAYAEFVLVIALGVLVPATSVIAQEHGTMELCERLHVFTANSYPGGTMIKYKNSQSSMVSTTTFQGHHLPPPSICSHGYKRCNLHITSKFDGTIRVVIFPLSSGIGLVSYNYLSTNDTLVYREQFVLTQTFPNCTYMYFTETREVVGYCLDLYSRDQPYMYSLRIGIQHDALSRSIVRQPNVGESIKLINLASLSDFVFFDSNQDPVDRCFPDEDGHVICLENGEVLDHSISGEHFIPYRPHISECSNASRLFHVGTTCKLVAHCSDKVFLFEVHQDQATALSDGSSGQVFICPDLQIVKLRNGTLSLHTENSTQTRKLDPFPLERIHQGDCFIVDKHYIFFATLVDGRTLLSNFTSMSYQQLGVSEHATCIPSRVKDQIGLVHNGSDTLVYDLSLPCHQEPTVIPDNFILASYFSTGTRDQCWCLSDSGPSMPVSQPTVSPTFVKNNQRWVVPLAVVLPVTVVVKLLCIMIIICCIYKKHKRSSTSSGENGIKRLHVENPLIQNNNASEVKLDILRSSSQKSNSDQKSITPESESSYSQGTIDPLLDTEPRLNSNHLPTTENFNNENQLMSELRPGSTLSACTSETTDASECVFVQASCSSRPSTGDREMLVGASASIGSQYHHRRLQEVGQANTTAIQCTSPRNSYHAGAGSPSHAHNNNIVTVVIPQGSPVNGSVLSAVNFGQSDNSASDAVSPLHSSPVEATADNGRLSYLTGPQHFLASGANPHPDDVRRTHQRREGRLNEQDFRQLMEYARANGEPNNDAALIERQRADDSENNRS